MSYTLCSLLNYLYAFVWSIKWRLYVANSVSNKRNNFWNLQCGNCSNLWFLSLRQIKTLVYFDNCYFDQYSQGCWKIWNGSVLILGQLLLGCKCTDWRNDQLLFGNILFLLWVKATSCEARTVLGRLKCAKDNIEISFRSL